MGGALPSRGGRPRLRIRRPRHTYAPLRDSEEALAIVRDNPQVLDLLVTDQTMPKTTGLELAADARALAPHLRVLRMTGFTSRISLSVVQEAGVSKVLAKPHASAELAEVVREALAPSAGADAPGPSQE